MDVHLPVDVPGTGGDDGSERTRWIAGAGLAVSAVRIVPPREPESGRATWADQAAEWATHLGCRIVTADVSGSLERPDGETERARVRSLVDVWSRAAGRCADRGRRLLWQVNPLADPGLSPSIIDQVLRGVASAHFGIVFDTGAMEVLARRTGHEVIQEGKPIRGCLGLLERFKGDIGAITLSEPESWSTPATPEPPPPGAGSLDWDRLLPALIDAWVPNPWWTISLANPSSSSDEPAARFFRDRVASRLADAKRRP